MGCGVSCILMCSFLRNVLKRVVSSLRKGDMGSYVVSSECWPTQVIGLLSANNSVVWYVCTRLTRWPMAVIYFRCVDGFLLD